MVPFLPNELLQAILEHVKGERYEWYEPQRTLSRCCRSSKTFLAIARPLLYHHIKLSVGVVPHYKYCEKQFQFGRKSYGLVRTLQCHCHLRRMIKHVSFEGIDRGSSDWEEESEEDPADILGPLMELLDAGTIIALSNLAHIQDIDQVLSSAQTRPASNLPLLRRIRNADDNDDGETIYEAAYEGYQADDFLGIAPCEKRLVHSFNSLRRLDIPFASFTPLQHFLGLKRLALRLSDALHFEHEHIDVDRDLVTLLPTLTSLQFLVLGYDNDFDFNPSQLLESGSLARALPPNLTQLSLDLDLESSEVLAFLQDLPQATTLEKLNYRWRKDDKEEVAEECRTRGIELSWNHKWEVW